MPETICILVRLRRTIHEDAYVRVPVSSAVMSDQSSATGFKGIDGDKLFAAAVQLGADPRVDWQVEDRTVQPNPTQQPLPNGRKAFDVHDECTPEN